jgi:hypothetical protein
MPQYLALTPALLEALAHPAVPDGQLLWFCDKSQFETYAEAARSRSFRLYAPCPEKLPRIEELVETVSQELHVLVGCCDAVSAAILLQGFTALAAENLPVDRIRTVLVSGDLMSHPMVAQQAAALCDQASRLNLRIALVPDCAFGGPERR